MYLTAGALLLAHPPGAVAWEVAFGGCSFSRGSSQELVRTGACASQYGILSLYGKGIASLPAGVFDDMGGVT